MSAVAVASFELCVASAGRRQQPKLLPSRSLQQRFRGASRTAPADLVIPQQPAGLYDTSSPVPRSQAVGSGPALLLNSSSWRGSAATGSARSRLEAEELEPGQFPLCPLRAGGGSPSAGTGTSASCGEAHLPLQEGPMALISSRSRASICRKLQVWPAATPGCCRRESAAVWPQRVGKPTCHSSTMAMIEQIQPAASFPATALVQAAAEGQGQLRRCRPFIPEVGSLRLDW